jgi:hypothetical protein
MNTTTFKENGAVEDIKNDICEKLNDYKGGSYYGCDLAYTLFECDNVNGSVFCNTYRTEQYIKANWNLFGELVEHYKSNFGETLNPFTEPEKAHVIFELEAAQGILAACPTIDDNWNNQLELTEKTVKKLIKEVKAFNGDIF